MMPIAASLFGQQKQPLFLNPQKYKRLTAGCFYADT